MSTTTKRIFRNLQKVLPNTCLCKDVLVLTPTEHILRGFLFQHTMKKGRCYFWAFAMPLYTSKGFIVLSYGKRIPDKETFQISEENVDEVSDDVLELITDGYLDHFRSVARPADFLNHMHTPWSGFRFRNRAFMLDLALTHFMVRNVPECQKILEESLAIDDGLQSSPWAEDALTVLDDLKADPPNAARRLEGWERENIERLGLAKAIGKIA